MITFLSILSSIAVIVYSVIAYAQYLAGKQQHKERLQVELLNKQKDDFIKWFNDYLHLTQVLVGVSIQLNMDLLEDNYHGTVSDATEKTRRQLRIAENSRSRDRNAVDLNYQMMLLNLVIDDRKPYFVNAQVKIRENHDLLLQKLEEFKKEIHRDFVVKIQAPEVQTFELFRRVMDEARGLARQVTSDIEKANHNMGEQVRKDAQALEDEIERVL